MSLPIDMRTELVDLLLQSLNAPIHDVIEQAWIKEAHRRIEEINSGKVKSIPSEQVYNEIHKRFQR